MRKEYDFSQGKRGAFLPAPAKIRITITLDDDVIEFYRSQAKSLGVGYQTLINAALRAAMEQSSKARKKEEKPLSPVAFLESQRHLS
jgi:uncharacterized protein (DUF4415 family)